MALIPFLGKDFFPTVDAGEFKLHIRGKTGTRVEETARSSATRSRRRSARRFPANEVDGILDNIGLPYSGINLSYSNSGVIGTADADILVSLKPGHKPTAGYQRQLRIDLPQEFPGTLFTFQPADIVSQILNFGLPAPIDIQFIGTKVNDNLDLARKVADQVSRVCRARLTSTCTRSTTSPRLNINMDRNQAEQIGLTASNIAQSVLVSLSGSFQTCADLLPRSEKWRELQHRDPGAAVQHQLDPGPGEHPAAWHEAARRCWPTWRRSAATPSRP